MAHLACRLNRHREHASRRQRSPSRPFAAVTQKIQTVFIHDLDGSDADGTAGPGWMAPGMTPARTPGTRRHRAMSWRPASLPPGRLAVQPGRPLTAGARRPRPECCHDPRVATARGIAMMHPGRVPLNWRQVSARLPERKPPSAPDSSGCKISLMPMRVYRREAAVINPSSIQSSAVDVVSQAPLVRHMHRDDKCSVGLAERRLSSVRHLPKNESPLSDNRRLVQRFEHSPRPRKAYRQLLTVSCE